MPISFGDNVRILKTDITDNLGLAGLTGTIFGFTIPSSSGITGVVGSLEEDYAVSVHLDSLGESRWFSTELIEFVSASDVKSMTINGVKLIQDATGEWVVSDTK